SNQGWQVLNENLEPCPPWVVGSLYISGIGLALGYWQDSEKTEASFITHPVTHERLYRTGDLGRYRPDGVIELVGREDFQVKVNGYRIELGEVEACLEQHPAIQTAVVATVGEKNSRLAAYLVANQADEDSGSPMSRLDFKLERHGLRSFKEDKPGIALPSSDNDSEAPVLQRQSFRQFLDQPCDLEKLSDLLTHLRSRSIPNSPLPKYRYASAGSLYPVQTYLHLKGDRVTGIDEGFYYYHPAEHRLISLSLFSGEPDSIYRKNKEIFESASFSLFFVADLNAIEPIYGEQAQGFCFLEAGYMGQLLMEEAPELDLGLCPLGGLGTEALAQALDLSDSHLVLHGMTGGLIDPAWTNQWQVAAGNSSPSADLQTYLKQSLPSYMVPQSFQWLETLPLSANGKIDRNALPEIALPTTEKVAPRTGLEKEIAQIWTQVLEIESVSIHDNFFDAGGNSLTAMQAVSQLKQTFQLDLSIRSFFTAPTIAEQATLIQNHKPTEPDKSAIEIPKLERVSDTTDLEKVSGAELDALLQQMMLEEEVSP
ncbi:MAG: SagB family peptide dehydrogenase, partial [Cyanobacteria bacterium P01_F01_bin.42]